MIADGQLFITTHWWISAMPGLAVVITGIAFSMLGDGIGDALRIDRGRVSPGRASSAHARAGRSSVSAAPLAAAALVPGEVRVDGLRIAASADGDELVSGLTFAAPPGSALGIVGESGSGKSLTLRALLGMMPSGTR